MFTMKNYVQASSLEEAYALRKKSKKNVILGGNLWMKMGSRNIMTGIDLCSLSLDRLEENEKEYKMYLRAKNSLKNLEKRLNGKPIPESIKLGVERRKEILETFNGLGI